MFKPSYFAYFSVFFLFFSGFLSAQNSDTPKPISNTYFLQNCFVVKQPGTVLSGQNVIIRDGFIAEVGAGIKAPFDAQWIKSDSMYVYAGFIDAHSHTGIVKPEAKDRPKVNDPGNPPNDVAGITPQLKSADVFKSSDKSVGDMRAAGFGISNVAPRGLMLPGQNSVFLLNDGQSDKLLLRANSSQNLQLETNRGVFPSTTIGVMAKFRELYKNAAIAGAHDEKFKLNPAGLSRPDYSKEILALYPVTTKKVPLFFKATNSKDVHKALSLRDELNFDMVLTEVKQGWHYIDRIKKSNTGVLLSLELPEEEKKEEKKDAKSEEKKDSTSTAEVKTPEKKEINPEKDSFDAKKEESVKQHLAQAAVFEKNGIKFAFSFQSVKPSDVKKNIKRLIDNGLTENGALAALTTYPAQMLGISNITGTVEKGKLANLVITDKSYFDEKSSIKYVFVDGKKYDFVEKPKKDNKPSEGGKLVGSWSYTVEIPGSTQKGRINIKKSAGEYKITVVDDSNPNEEDTADNISVEGNNVTFFIMADMGMPVKVDFDLNFEGKSYNGNISVGQFGSFPIKGDYEGDPK